MEKQPDGLSVYVDGQPLAQISEITETPELPEGAPKVGDNMPLEVYIRDSLVEKLPVLVERLNPIMEWATMAIHAVGKVAIDCYTRHTDYILQECNDNPRWWHLYKHSKKARIRKKYRKRLMQQALRKRGII